MMLPGPVFQMVTLRQNQIFTDHCADHHHGLVNDIHQRNVVVLLDHLE